MYKIIVKRRKSEKIEQIGKSYAEILIAEAALGGLKAGLGSRFIRKSFTYIEVVKAWTWLKLKQ